MRLREFNELEQWSIEEWFQQAVIAEIKCLLGNYDELGMVLSEHLQKKHGVTK